MDHPVLLPELQTSSPHHGVASPAKRSDAPFVFPGTGSTRSPLTSLSSKSPVSPSNQYYVSPLQVRKSADVPETKPQPGPAKNFFLTSLSAARSPYQPAAKKAPNKRVLNLVVSALQSAADKKKTKQRGNAVAEAPNVPAKLKMLAAKIKASAAKGKLAARSRQSSINSSSRLLRTGSISKQSVGAQRKPTFLVQPTVAEAEAESSSDSESESESSSAAASRTVSNAPTSKPAAAPAPKSPFAKPTPAPVAKAAAPKPVTDIFALMSKADDRAKQFVKFQPAKLGADGRAVAESKSALAPGEDLPKPSDEPDFEMEGALCF